MFIGRERELVELNKRYHNDKKEFGVIYGREHIGKSFLINEFLKDKNCLFFQAKEDCFYGNLASLSCEINKKIGLPTSFVYSSYESAIDRLLESMKEERFVFTIDEYPYIVRQDPSVLSVLQRIIDRAPDNIFFLISSSDVLRIKNEFHNPAFPLFRRNTFEMKLEKLRYKEALAFLDGCDVETKLKYLSLTSTYPYYLSAINFDLSFEDNIRELLFNPFGLFFALGDELLSNSTKTQDVYNAILHAVSKRKRTNKDIAQAIHEDEAKVSKYIGTLIDQELLEKRETYLGTKKTIYYEIGDPMLRFWYEFIFGNKDKINFNGKFVFESLQNEIKKFVEFGFEEISRLYMEQLNIDGKLGDIYSSFKPYRVEKSILNRSVEIDGLGDNGKTLIVIECKYRKEKYSLNMFNHLKESASVFPSKLKREYYLFSKSGFSEEIRSLTDESIHLIFLEDLFKFD